MALCFGRVVVDLSTGEVRCDGEPVTLRDKERDVLLYLARAGGRVVSREELLFEVWDYKPGVESRTVDTTIRRLRARLDLARLQTVRGEGYRLAPLAEPDGQLPERPALEGRQPEIEAVLEHLLRRRHVALAGPSGMGATAIAAEVAHRLRERGLPVTWWSGDAPPPPEGWLVHDDPGPEGLALAAARDGALVVVRRLAPAPFVNVRVGPLDPEAGARMLAQRLVVRGLAVDLERCRAVARINDGVPRALELAARRSELDAPVAAVPVDLVGEAELPEARAISVMAHLDFPLDAELLAVILGSPAEEAAASMSELAERGLLVREGTGWRLLEPLAVEVRRSVAREPDLSARAILALTERLEALRAGGRYAALRTWKPALRQLVPLATGKPLFELLRALVELGQRVDTDPDLPRWIAGLRFETAHDQAIQAFAHVQALENADILPAVLAHAPAAAAALSAIDKPGLEGWVREAYIRAALECERPEEARAQLGPLRAAWEKAGEEFLLCLAEVYELQCAQRPGEPVPVARYRAIGERLVALGRADSAGFPLSAAGAQLLTWGPIESGVGVLEEALVWTEASPHARAGIHGQLAASYAALGDTRAAHLHLEQARPALELGLGHRASFQIAAGVLAAVEGRDDDALEALLAAEDHLRWSGSPAVPWTRRLRAALEGEPDRVPPVEHAVVERVVTLVDARRPR
jgi:DNA-binding winged helix-turn-helix (wHTH) protein